MIYTDRNTSDYTLRTFSNDVPDSELVWHRDQEDREVSSIYETDWQLQLEDELPISLNETTFIPAGSWHRVIKGTSDLTLKIKKHDD